MDKINTLKRSAPKDFGEASDNKDSEGNDDIFAKFQDELKKRRNCDSVEISRSPSSCCLDGPCLMPLLSIPNVEECSSKASIVFTGTASRGGTGPSVGAVDIGVSRSAYMFRVALPGVKKEPGLFSCEVERDGKVHVRGVTSTGGTSVSRYSRVFEMKFRRQCPPGPFTLSFSLPGPVDPRFFLPNFRSDGILEAVIGKYE